MCTSPLYQVSQSLEFPIGLLLESHHTDVSVNTDGTLLWSPDRPWQSRAACCFSQPSLCRSHSGKEEHQAGCVCPWKCRSSSCPLLLKTQQSRKRKCNYCDGVCAVLFCLLMINEVLDGCFCLIIQRGLIQNSPKSSGYLKQLLI